MAGRKLRIGFIGSGHIARVHAEALRAMKGVRLTACADVDPANAKRLAETFGCKPTTDIAEVIAASDAVWVCSPPKCHRQHAVACLDAGRAVYLLKYLIPIHIFGNLFSFMFISMHFFQQITRPPQFYPDLGTGVALYLVMLILVSTGFLHRFQLLRSIVPHQNRFIHISITSAFYIVIFTHVLQGIGIF